MSGDDRFQTLKRILLRALEMPAARRAAWVAQECAGDDELRAEVEAKLARLGEDASVLLTGGVDELVRAAHGDETMLPDDDRTVAAAGGAPLAAGDRILPAGPARPPGPEPDSLAGYRILGKLGEGGMGVVYLAEQRSPRRRVALKVIRGGHFVDDLRVKMFQREAETLGRLKHPNIAAIYESGRTDDGQHFFAMELIQGATLDEYLGSRRADRSEPGEVEFRLRLFRKIADAVHYAHQRGVIHRDLKPSNVIVTEGAVEGSGVSGAAGPEVKVLDFGLARITDSDVQATTMSEVGAIKGTLPYMSPEQTRGNPDEIDVRTDVYSLGVLLYEMLTEGLPYDTGGTSLVQALRVICEEPPRSMRFSFTGRRGLDPDVETIVLKALEKDADRRYPTASALADDVARYLASEPIVARPPSTMYQLRKFASRNRVLVGGVAATIASLAVGLVISVAQYLQAESERRAAEEARATAERESERATAVQEFLQEMITTADPYESEGPLITMDEVLHSAAEKIDGRFADRPEVEGSLRFTIGRTYIAFDLKEEAIAQLEPAVPLLRETRPGSRELAECLRFLGEAYEGIQDPRCIPILQESVALHTEISGPDHLDVATALHDLAFGYQVVARQSPPAERDSLLALSEKLYLESQDVFREIHGERHEAFARCLQAYSVTLWRMDRRDEAVAMIDKAIEIGEEVRSDLFLGSLYQDRAFLARALGDDDTAMEKILRAAELKKKVWGEGSMQYAWALRFLADLHRRGDRPEEAVEILGTVAAIIGDHRGPDDRERVDVLDEAMRAYAEIGDPDRGRDVGLECLALRRTAASDAPGDPQAQRAFADALLSAWPPSLRDPVQAARTADAALHAMRDDDDEETRGFLVEVRDRARAAGGGGEGQ